MCRFFGFLGYDEILIDKLLYYPSNSLIKQSHSCRESISRLNGDGFGLAWYKEAIDSKPAVFKSTQPAWNDINLKHISQKTISNCIIAHVRAATVGDVNITNCHPFYFEDFVFVHNGNIQNFSLFKRTILSRLSNELFQKITGQTDSEYIFFLIMQFYLETKNLTSACIKAIKFIEDLQSTYSTDISAKINILITDGKSIFATKYSSKDAEVLSLKYSYNPKFINNKNSNIIISSEALDDESEWINIPDNSYLYLESINSNVIIKHIN